MELAEQIRKHRHEMGISQEDLAERIYVSRQTVSNWETSKTYPDVQSLLMLSVLFSVTIDELIKGDRHAMEEIMKKDAKLLQRYAWITVALTLAAVVVMIFGVTVWEWELIPSLFSGGLLTIMAISYANKIEALKKKHDLVTIQELESFEKGEEVDRYNEGSVRWRTHRRRYEAFKVLAGAVFGMILGLFLMLLINYVFGWTP